MRLPLLVLLALLAAACASSAESASVDTEPPDTAEPLIVPVGDERDFGPAPAVPSGPLTPEVADAIGAVFNSGVTQGIFGSDQNDALDLIGESGDVRVAWLLVDLMRFAADPGLLASVIDEASELLGIETTGRSAWGDVTDHLIAWDVPEPPGFLDTKRELYSQVVPAWADLMVPGAIDWRLVTWGGVGIDDRRYDRTDDPCRCIPAADNPEVSSADEADWLDDDAVVFGVTIGDESRAYPRRIMEVREMVNDTLGGRDFAMPYCTLCGSAQVYLTDEMPDGVDRPILRTSGLLIRSNKVMYDLNTNSVFDTFRGDAVTGPLAELGLVLDQVPVVTTTWGDWRQAHPETTVLIEDLALGRDFDFRNGRDADGPIFPIGDADPRLPVHADVLGVVTESGPLAFWVDGAIAALEAGRVVEAGGVSAVLDGGGVRAVDGDGESLPSHQAFWFAWSQFHPETELWTG